MDVIIAVSGSCPHCSLLRKELEEMNISYEVHHLAEHPELFERFGLQGSPNIIVDGELVFRKMPELSEFRRYFKERQGGM
ncbi:MAG TPA: thioredoxin family protein [Desulfosarcina sp.]|nr:thioredoxin family protein [Desulfosarcina sp.]